MVSSSSLLGLKVMVTKGSALCSARKKVSAFYLAFCMNLGVPGMGGSCTPALSVLCDAVAAS